MSQCQLYTAQMLVPKRERSEEKHRESRTPPACQEKLHCRGQKATRRALSSGASTRIGSAAVRSRDLITPGCCSHKLLWWVIFAPLLLARTEGLQILYAPATHSALSNVCQAAEYIAFSIRLSSEWITALTHDSPCKRATNSPTAVEQTNPGPPQKPCRKKSEQLWQHLTVGT